MQSEKTNSQISALKRALQRQHDMCVYWGLMADVVPSLPDARECRMKLATHRRIGKKIEAKIGTLTGSGQI